MKTISCIIPFLFLIRSCDSPVPAIAPIAGANTSVAAFVDFFPSGPIDSAVLVRSMAELERTFGAVVAQTEAGCNVEQFFLNGGTEAWIVRVAGTPSVAALLGDSVSRSGMYSLGGRAGFNLLCFPRLADTSDVQRGVMIAGSFCERHRAMFVMDAPKSLATPSSVSGWIAGSPSLRSRNVALYYPGIRTAKQPAGTGASGTVAGIISRTDAQRGVWKAPAGTDATMAGVTGLERMLTDAEGSQLNQQGINTLRTFPTAGNVVWGARVLTDDPEWKYVPVRRTALFIEESVVRGTVWAQFEPNRDSLWLRVRLSVEDFMRSLWRKGAFQGNTPAKAFFVKCDRQTTTQEDMANGVFTILIGFAPLKPAEFLLLTIRQHAARNSASAP